MSNTEISIVEKVELIPFFTKGENVADVLDAIETEAKAFVPDITTTKGRDAIKKMVTKVTRSKTYLEGKGKDLSAEYKAIPKVIDANRKEVRERLTELAAQVRQPLTDYEEECKRIAIEKMKEEEALKLAEQVEADHEIGLLLNEKIDREIEAAKQEELELAKQAEADRIAREKRIAEEAAERERQASIEREAEAKRQAEAAEKARIEAEARAKVEAEQAEKRAIEAAKQAKIEAEQAAERARLAEIARQEAVERQAAEDQAKREANKKHIGAIRSQAKESIMALGIDEAKAKALVLAIHSGKIQNVSIKY